MSANAVAEPDSQIQETQFSRQDGISRHETSTNGASAQTSIQHPKLPASSTKAPRVLGPDLLRGFLMILQAIDHAAVSSGAWGHGQGTQSEADGQIVTKWISPIGWTARTMTHLCAPGFMFLLGMGIVYFGRSRTKLGWSSLAMARHFFIRGLVLAIVSELIGLILMRQLSIVNTVLLALAFNYFVVGLVWLLMSSTEAGLTRMLSSKTMLASSSSDERRPLLANETASSVPKPSKTSRASLISFHVHNVILAAIAVVAIWLNLWMSPNNGHCAALKAAVQQKPSPSGRGEWFDFWFYSIWTPHVMSGFPPLAWLSFAFIGVLYARLVLANPARPARVINVVSLMVGLVFLLLFVATRLLHFGNLSEDCIHTPEQEHVHGSSRNQYLASFQSFFYIIKYPPSPAYLFFTMGMNFILLAGFGSIPENIARRLPGLLVFGTSALFFYAIHLPLYGALAAVAKKLFGKEDPDVPDMGTGGPVIGIGDGLVFWTMWLIGLLILYPLCRWYGRFKGTKAPDSVWRFF